MLRGKGKLPAGHSLSIEEMDQAVMTEARRRAREDVFGCLGPVDRRSRTRTFTKPSYRKRAVDMLAIDTNVKDREA